MMQLDTLWKERAGAFWKIALRYFRLIGNSSFLFTLVLTLIFGAYYYSELLKVLPESFPGLVVITGIAAVVLVRTPLRFFLYEADLVFLLPAEGRLNGYFRKSLIYSFLLQVFTTVVVLTILAPLYQHETNAGTGYYVFVIAVLIILKGLNVIMKWLELHLPEHRSVVGYILLRLLLTMLITYLLLIQAQWLYVAFAVGLIVGILFLLFLPLQKKYSIKWQRLLSVDEHQSMKFYRTANLFTDVPKLKQSVKHRRMLSAFAEKVLPVNTVYATLYQKAFIRSNEYFGIYIRLLLVGLALIAFVPSETGRIIGAALIVYLTAVQLRTLYPHYQSHVMVKLYPISDSDQEKAYRSLLTRLLGTQAAAFALLSLILHFNLVEFILIALAGAASVVFATVSNRTKKFTFMN
ncbi:ABC transporter permease [Pseudalkalibacillus hwajinpoensis]|uniref:ABC transporter permease n=1 Tax=Guptibacillus hwajinpoensis TaxID=208199 RepID=A0A4U1MC65_9BACL|nr:ABC transporter permease [Pseudalkalibacillus hwajinpoensis]TKD68699.1 ABC transporter permease [Pseudalkalibacillus hwajinpoensis]